MSAPQLPKTGNALIDAVLALAGFGLLAWLTRVVAKKVEERSKVEQKQVDAEPMLVKTYTEAIGGVSVQWERYAASLTARMDLIAASAARAEERAERAEGRVEQAEHAGEQMEVRAKIAEANHADCERRHVALVSEVSTLRERVKVLETANTSQ